MTFFLLSILVFLVAPVAALLWLKIPQYFNFVNLYFLLQCFLILPAAIALVGGSAMLHFDVLRSLTRPLVDAVSTFMILYGIMNIFVLVGLVIAVPSVRRIRAIHGLLERPRNPNATMLFAWAMVLLALVLFVLKTTQIGGFAYLFANTSRRVELQAGLGPINILQEGAFWVALLLAAKLAALKGAKRSWILSLVLILGLACLTSTVFGGRKSAIQYIVGTLIIISFYRTSFFRMTPGNTLRLIALAGGLLVYFFSVQAYRDTNDIAEFGSQIPDLVERSVESASEVSMSLSYLDTYIFATEHYDPGNRRYGATFADLSTAFLPSVIVKDKPAVDDGMYLRADTIGQRVKVGGPASQFTNNSWPPETYGSAMMNFGLLSLPIFGIVLGILLGLSLKYLISSRGSDFAVLLTTHVFLNFEITNLRIVNLIVFAISITIFLKLYQLLIRKRRSRRTRAAA